MGLRFGAAAEGRAKRLSVFGASVDAAPDSAPRDSGLATSFTAQLAIHAEVRPRHGFETCVRDRSTCGYAAAVTAVLHSGERGVDLFDEVTCGCRKNQVAFPLHGDRVAVAGFLVELRVALVAFAHERVSLRLQFLCLMEMTDALFF